MSKKTPKAKEDSLKDKTDWTINSSQKNRKIKLLLTGGHAATTALAVIEYITSLEKDWEIVWAGSKYAFEGSDRPSYEAINFPKAGVKFLPIITGKLQTKFTTRTIPSLFKIPMGFIDAFKVVLQEKPNIVVSFGGFAGFPIVIAAWVLQIPVIVHEQTAVVGRANRYSGRYAIKIALARSVSEKYFDPTKCELIGNPLSKQITKLDVKSKKSKTPTILVTGGSRGSRIINDTLLKSINKLTKKYKIIHVVGVDDLSRFKVYVGEKYKIYPTVDPEKMAELYSLADILVARSGANTVAEAMHLGLPSLFIPIPFSYLNEQTINAQIAQTTGIAEILPQSKLNPTSLIRNIEKIDNNWQKIVSDYKKPFDDSQATHKMYRLIKKLL